MSTIELLGNEARRLLELWMAKSADYYAASANDESLLLAQSSAAEYALNVIVMVRSCAMTNSYTTTEERLRECIAREKNRLVVEYLEDVLAKVLALPEHATPKACSESSSA